MHIIKKLGQSKSTYKIKQEIWFTNPAFSVKLLVLIIDNIYLIINLNYNVTLL